MSSSGHILTPKELMALLSLLDEKFTDHQTFDTIAATFHSNLPNFDAFRVGLAFVALLQHPDLLPNPTQRLAALFLLYHMYRNEPIVKNPFVTVFTSILHPGHDVAKTRPVRGGPIELTKDRLPKLTHHEKHFLAQLITSKTDSSSNSTKDLTRYTPKLVINTTIPADQIVDISAVLSAVQLRDENLISSPLSKVNLPGLLPDPDLKFVEQPRQEGPIRHRSIEKIITSPEVANVVELELVRYPPPNHPVTDDELVWLFDSDLKDMELAWDTSMGLPPASGSSDSEGKRLLMKAFKSSLTPQQQADLVKELSSDPKIITQVGLTPARLPDLVEKNPTVAIDVLINLIHSPQVSDYLAALISMEMSVHSMEVVNHLTTVVELPHEFMQMYIAKCIQTCEQIKDRYHQNRMIRLVCVFLQALIRNRLINMSEFYIEVQAFCIEFSRIKEAAALFRLIKQMDGSGLTDSTTSGGQSNSGSGGTTGGGGGGGTSSSSSGAGWASSGQESLSASFTRSTQSPSSPPPSATTTAISSPPTPSSPVRAGDDDTDT